MIKSLRENSSSFARRKRRLVCISVRETILLGKALTESIIIEQQGYAFPGNNTG